MFPDSRSTNIDCGRTKAGYIIRFALAPFVKEQLVDTLSDNSPFAIHVDETSETSELTTEKFVWIIG